MALQYGYYDLDDAYSASYSHASVGISRPFGPISLTLAFHDTFGDAQEIFYTRSVGSRFDLSIDIGLFR